MAYMTALARLVQNNATLLEYNDSRNYEHQGEMTYIITASGSKDIATNFLSTGEVLLMVKSDQNLTLRIQDTANTVDATVKVNRCFMATLKGLTALTITNDGAASANVSVVMADL